MPSAEPLAALLPLMRRAARNGSPDEKLVLVNAINARGLIILQTIWEDAYGHRRTDYESTGDAVAAITRLAELAPLLCRAVAPAIATLPPKAASAR